MSINIDLEELWRKQDAAIPDSNELYRLASSARKKQFVKLIAANILYLLTATFIAAIWIYYKPQLLSTKIGITLSILAMFIYLAAYNQMLPLLRPVKDDVKIGDYLKQLTQLQKKEIFLQTTVLNIYFALLTAGIYLYIYEYTAKTLLSILIAYGVTTLWFAFNWFYLRPKTIKKQQLKTNELIAKFTLLNKQLSDD